MKIEETIDVDFAPDVAVADGEEIALGPGLTMTAVHTPGHTSNHTCYALAEPSVLFTGDHVMGWSTTVVSPPDGDMADYIESLRKVAGRATRCSSRPTDRRGATVRRTSPRSSSTGSSVSAKWSTRCVAVSTRSRRSWPSCTPTSGPSSTSPPVAACWPTS